MLEINYINQNNTFLVKNLKVLPRLHDQKVVFAEKIEINNKNYLISASYDKKVQLQLEDQSVFYESDFPKKISFLYLLDDKKTIHVVEKNGDHHKLNIEFQDNDAINITKTVNFSSNLAIPKCWTSITSSQKKYLLLGDDQNKIKILDYDNIQNMLNIWIPFESYLKKCMQFGDKYIMIFKTKNKKSIECEYSIYSLNNEHILNEEFQGQLMTTIPEVDSVKTCKIDDNTFAVLKISKKIELIIYNISGKIVKSFEIEALEIKSKPSFKLFNLEGAIGVFQSCLQNELQEKEYIEKEIVLEKNLQIKTADSILNLFQL